MYNKEDFFSPERVDERLDLSLQQRELDTPYHSQAEKDPNLLLISDLRYLYGAEGTENVRSLQRVWEHLQHQPARAESAPERPASAAERPRHLRLLNPAEAMPAPVERKRRGRYGRGLAALAAVLFLVIMVGSLLTIVRLTRSGLASPAATQITATSEPGATPQPTLVPNYPYALPGRQLVAPQSSTDAFTALAWAPNDRRLALSTRGQIWLWDMANHTYQPLLNARMAGGNVKALAWSPNGRYLAVGSDTIEIVDTSIGQVVSHISADYPFAPIVGQTTLVTALGWSVNGQMLAVATQHADGTCLVFIWNISGGTGISKFTQQGSASGITSLSWSGDNSYVASADGNTVQAWSINDPTNVIFEHAIDAITTVAWSPAPNVDPSSSHKQYGNLAFGSQHQTQVWNVWGGNHKQGKLLNTYPAGSSIASWSPDGQYLATTAGQTVLLFDAYTSALVYTYSGSNRLISSLAWSPDGSAIALGEGSPSGLNYARIWSA